LCRTLRENAVRLLAGGPRPLRVHAWQVTGNEFFRTITEEILDYAVREMLDLAGAFYGTQDADPTSLRSGDDRSEGEKGKFFVWTPDEIREVLGDEAYAFMAAYGVTRRRNSEAQVPGSCESKDNLLPRPREIATVGDPDSADTQTLPNVVCDGYRPFQVIPPGAPDWEDAKVSPLLDRGLVDGQAAAYVCRDCPPGTVDRAGRTSCGGGAVVMML